MKIYSSKKLNIYLKSFKLTITRFVAKLEPTGEHHSVKQYYLNPIKQFKLMMYNSHHNWAMDRLKTKSCWNCGKPCINPNPNK